MITDNPRTLARRRPASPRRATRPTLAWVGWAVALLGAGAPAAARAAVADGGRVVGEFTGGRAQSMGRAHRGDGQGNETLLFNPAGMALTSRYSLEAQYGYLGADHLHGVAVSVVDSKSSRLAAGLRATRAWGNPSGLDLGVYQLAAGSAWAVTDRLAVGAVLKNHRGHWRPQGSGDEEDISLWTGSVGAMARLGPRLALGAVGENLVRVRTAHQSTLRPAVSMGLGATLGRLALAADGRLDLRDGASRLPDLSVGGELMVMTGIACRLGYYTDQTWVGAARRQAATAGLGLLSAAASFHVGLERAFSRPAAWGVFTGFQLAV